MWSAIRSSSREKSTPRPDRDRGHERGSDASHGREPAGQGAATLHMTPLLARFPLLARVPRVVLTTLPTPVERFELPEYGVPLWVKRDDLSAAGIGGNKVRALEFLLGGVPAGATVLTVGGLGSTHVLATAHHAGLLGIHTEAIRWPHERDSLADEIAQRAAALCVRVTDARSPVDAMARAAWRRVRGTRWIPAGGSTALGVLGHVNAGLELAEQVSTGMLPEPARAVVPLGSGGTAAGLALGLQLAGLATRVYAVRVAPRIVANAGRVRALADDAASLIARVTGSRIAALERWRLVVEHDLFGGAYGRRTTRAEAAAEAFRAAGGPPLDMTYSAKAAVSALYDARVSAGPTLFWLTFDARWIDTPPHAERSR
jgi:1-aminocyclopropane-1-carboxylate deaminase/D-cysteine desulfhydrase-like pyridoxal-dependent ACC family enzyme